MRTRVHAIMDTIWPLGFVLIAVVSFLLSAGSGVVGRRVLVLVLTAVWGLRLGAHIYTRNRGQGRAGSCGSCRCRCRRRCTSTPRLAWFRGWVRRCGRWGSASRRRGAQLRRIRADPANAGRLLEKHMARSKGAAYAEYVRRTSGFIPRPADCPV